MTMYVLVHGAWRGSWVWNRVRRLLQARGHEVFTPTLTGVGDRSHLLSPQVNLETHINDIENLIRWEELSDIVLCGHSYGGCVISGVADRVPNRIGALVYLDAFVLDNGQCLHDRLPPEHRNSQLEGARQTGEGWKVPPIPAEVFNVNAKDRDWVNRQCTLQPLATLQQPVQLTGGIDRIENVIYILANGWEPSPFPQFYEKAKARGWKRLLPLLVPLAIAVDHCVDAPVGAVLNPCGHALGSQIQVAGRLGAWDVRVKGAPFGARLAPLYAEALLDAHAPPVLGAARSLHPASF